MFSDVVHRQIAIDSVAHLTLGVLGFGCEDALAHLLNYVWPNMLENSPHVIQRFVYACFFRLSFLNTYLYSRQSNLCLFCFASFACDAMRVSLGPIKVLQYCLQALWHPARKVRE